MKKASLLLVGKNLKWLMGDAITPYALASETGVPQPTIFRILTGESNDPRTKTLQPLANYFGVSVAALRDQDLSSAHNELIELVDDHAKSDRVKLDDRQREWLELLNHLGSDDVAEFSSLIRSRQERNVRLLEELKGTINPRKPIHTPKIFEVEEVTHGKKQRSQSS